MDPVPKLLENIRWMSRKNVARGHRTLLRHHHHVGRVEVDSLVIGTKPIYTDRSAVGDCVVGTEPQTPRREAPPGGELEEGGEGGLAEGPGDHVTPTSTPPFNSCTHSSLDNRGVLRPRLYP